MTDLTNNTLEEQNTINEINILINKYASVLETIKDKEQIPIYAIIIDKGVNHLNLNHNDLNSDIKTWAIVVIKDLFNIKYINNYTEIYSIIDDFIQYYQQEHDKYMENIEHYVSVFNRDYPLINNYINKKISN